jgi:hypothetical protein
MNPTPDAKTWPKFYPIVRPSKGQDDVLKPLETRTLKEREPQEPTEDPGRRNATRRGSLGQR